jgi:chemotaxis protein methyltransferase CheR
LAHALAAEFFQDLGLHQAALHNIEQAAQAWRSWGAHALVESLSHRFADLPETSGLSWQSSSDAGKVPTAITQDVTSVQLDLDSITRASQLLSAETDLKELLTKMMTLVMANSGAEKAVLLLRQEDDWFVQARGDVETVKNDILLHLPYDPANSDDESVIVPERAFDYGRRSKEVLVVGDARLDHRFSEDGMIQKHNIKSMACVPALSRGELKALLYLENRQMPDVFTQERVEILKHLSSQFGVSVENALLYNHLTQAEAKYRTVADFTYDWEHWAKLDGTMEYVSPSCERISGYAVRDFEDNPSLFREIIVTQDREIWDGHRRDSRQELKPREIQFRIQRRDGQIRWIEHICQPMTDEQGRLQGFRASNRDVTERKQAEIELRSAYDQIEQLKDQLEAESAYLQDEIKLEHNFENIIGQSEALKYVLSRVEQVAVTDSPVLVMGETGTGKELVARAIHKLSLQGKRALVKVNCAALPAQLIESELFGREKGAFTDATTTQAGRFELAKGSTLFLDEIGELPLELQAKLLRVLESGEFERLGSPRTLHSDARIIAATNRVLEEEVRKGRFREDLWYRLKVFPITVPPLREHVEDIPLLVQWFVDQHARKMGKQVAEIPKGTMEMLQSYPWPGNVRELQHAVESALITAKGKKLSFELPKIADTASGDFKPFEEMERDYILRVLKARDWKIGGDNSAASTLGMHVNTLRGRMKKLGIKRPKLR